MNALTLFAGAGGADLGLRAAGFQHLACIEADAHACATLTAAGFPAVRAWIGGGGVEAPWDGWDLPGEGENGDAPRGEGEGRAEGVHAHLDRLRVSVDSLTTSRDSPAAASCALLRAAPSRRTSARRSATSSGLAGVRRSASSCALQAAHNRSSPTRRTGPEISASQPSQMTGARN